MSKIYQSVDQLVGKTPIIQLNNIKQQLQLHGNIFAKLEMFNPSGSVKDRIAKAMIEDAENKGLLKKGGVIIEPTSGNTGIGLASIGASKGYRVIIVMPETMSMERRQIMKALGAELVLTEGTKGMKGAIEKANQLASEIPNSFVPSQFDNMSNPAIHKATTGVEIWQDMDGNIDLFVAGVGTGGTLSGVGEYLKSQNNNIQVIAIEPIDSPVLTQGKSGAHKIQGIGAGFVPNTLNTSVYDNVVTVDTQEAFHASRLIATTEGLLVGISSGAALHTAIQIAKDPQYKDKNIVVILPDTGERYLSSPLFSQ